MTFVQEPPFSIQLEATEGCNLRCGMCGIRGIRENGPREDLSGPYSHMTIATATSIGRQVRALGWNPRLEFAMHGEPTMNPDLPELCRALRSYNPTAYMMVTTNAIPMLEGRQPWHGRDIGVALRRLFDAGVNTVLIDDYRPHRVAPTVREMAGGLPFPVIDYPANPKHNPHHRYKGQRVVIAEDIQLATSGSHATINNHAGLGAPPSEKMQGKVCTLPFRDLSIRWDGQVAMCCNDWRGEYRFGDADDLGAAWNGPEADAARSLLYHEGRAGMRPCDGCDYRPIRPGLLPDKLGKGTVPPVTDDVRAIARRAQAHGTMTGPVLRRWEKQVVNVDFVRRERSEPDLAATGAVTPTP